MAKPTLAVYSFANCYGCQLEVLNLGEDLVSLLDAVDVVAWQFIKREHSADILETDLALVEGAVTSTESEKRAREIRRKSETVVAIGACACQGGVPSLRNFHDLEETKTAVYGRSAGKIDAAKVRGLAEVIHVDAFARSCPVSVDELLDALTCLLRGRQPNNLAQTVCFECKANGNLCFYNRGRACLGVITRGGCNSTCINSNYACQGCRGLLEYPYVANERKLLNLYGLSDDEIRKWFGLFGLSFEQYKTAKPGEIMPGEEEAA